MYLGPIRFNEIFRPAPWGGRKLTRLAAKTLPPGAPIGESWELSDRSVVSEGPLAGRTLQQIVEAEPLALMGRRRARFPLLVKLLDVTDRLSVQVHPSDRCARVMKLQDGGKTEAWYILRAGPRGCLVTGFKSPRDLARLNEPAAWREIESRLARATPKVGEVWFCPAGAIHSAGPGVVVLEVQQNSDTTFRLYDWRRPGLDGRPRELHLPQASCAIRPALRLRRQKARKLRGMPFPASRLMACDKFVMDDWDVSARVALEKPKGFEILYVLSGGGTLSDGRWPPMRLSKGRTVLLPACVTGYELRPARRLRMVRIAEGVKH